ncbi:alcohol dehydrogenase [Porphyridium purpureum]|uniref:alcohol dehydrogenase n=1 Tax=Porphyridium purpureum TaxID=35688 RepID=A0A5J4YR10_PORPP|nr:alcohol dehydrogenase [Porphyridium purpureum]|eukprot:POR6665..scf296_7
MTLPETYKAAVTEGNGAPYVFKQVPTPTPGKGEILMRVHVTGVCHTDLHAKDGDWPVPPKAPLTGGHEGAGEVVAVGEDVTSLKIGDRVGIVWLYSACGECEHCVKGNETVCEKQHNGGYSKDGSFQEYCIADAKYCARIPDGVSYADAAPLLCAGVTTYKALKESEVKAGEYMTIVGAGGGLGHLAVQYAKAMGMNVIAIDGGDEKGALCKELGAMHYVDFMKTPNTVDEVLKITGGKGAEGVLCLATSNKVFNDCVHMCKRHGCVVLVSLPPGDFSIPIFPVVLKRITVRGSIVGTRQDLAECLEFCAQGKVKPIYKTQHLEDLNEVFQEMHQGKIAGRIVLEL